MQNGKGLANPPSCTTLTVQGPGISGLMLNCFHKRVNMTPDEMRRKAIDLFAKRLH